MLKVGVRSGSEDGDVHDVVLSGEPLDTVPIRTTTLARSLNLNNKRLSKDLSDDELAAYFALRSAGDRLQRAVTRQLRSYDLTEVQFSILAQLRSRTNGVGMSELARGLVVTKSGLTYQAGQLEGRGLVTRGTSADDDRAVLLQLTPDGEALLATVMPAHIALVRELFIDRIDPDDLATVRDALARVAQNERTSGP
jgi:DNA-binding MarR family transcriptional regulator